MKVSAQSGTFAVWFSVSALYFPKIFFCEVHMVISQSVCQDFWHHRIKCISGSSLWALPAAKVRPKEEKEAGALTAINIYAFLELFVVIALACAATSPKSELDRHMPSCLLS